LAKASSALDNAKAELAQLRQQTKSDSDRHQAAMQQLQEKYTRLLEQKGEQEDRMLASELRS
jgi:hypothetical protein